MLGATIGDIVDVKGQVRFGLCFSSPLDPIQKEGYDYCMSLGKTEKPYRAEQLSFIHSRS